MKRWLLDSNAVGAMLSHHPVLTTLIARAQTNGIRIGTCEPVVAELLYGIELSQSRDRNLVRLERVLRLLTCWPLDRDASRMYGKIAAHLRRTGRPMQTMDIMVASIALSLSEVWCFPATAIYSQFPV